jgi:hypothetical protein
MSQADTPPVIRPYAGQLQDQDEKGSMHDGLIWARTLPGRRQFLCAPIWRSGATPGSTSDPRWVTGLVGSLRARSAVRRADWRLTVRPMAMTERSDLLAAGGKQASAYSPASSEWCGALRRAMVRSRDEDKPGWGG